MAMDILATILQTANSYNALSTHTLRLYYALNGFNVQCGIFESPLYGLTTCIFIAIFDTRIN